MSACLAWYLKLNAALPKPLIVEIRITPKHHIQLISVSSTTSDILLKHREQLEAAIYTILPSTTGLQKEVQVVQVVIHNVPTTIPSTTEGFSRVLSEIEKFNPGTTLHRGRYHQGWNSIQVIESLSHITTSIVLCIFTFRPQTREGIMVVKNDVVTAEDILEGGQRDVAPPKAGWRSKVPIMACGAGLFSDGYLNGIIGVVNTILIRMWKEEYGPDKQRVVTSIGFTGIILGQLSFGFIVDKYSRKTGMLASSIILITFSILASLANGVGPRVQGIIAALTAYRFFLGIGIGGEYPSGSVACAEATAVQKKGTRNMWFILFTNTHIIMGIIVSTIMPIILLAAFGKNELEKVWRTALGLGAIFPTMIFWLRLFLDEGEQFKTNNLRKVKSIPWKLIMKYYWGRLLVCSTIWLIHNLSAFSFTLYSSYIIELVTGGEQSLLKTFGGNSCIMLFRLPGSIIGCFVSDKLGPQKTLAIGIWCQAIMGYIMASCFPILKENSVAFICVFGLFTMFGEFGPGNNIGLLAAKSSATAIRGKFYGLAAATGKLGGFVGTFFFDTIVEKCGGKTTNQGMAAPFYISSSLGIFAGFLAVFCLPSLGQDAVQDEDVLFKSHLLANGFDMDGDDKEL